MSVILSIDTAVQAASVALVRDGRAFGLRTSPSRNDSASWLHPAIRDLLREAGIKGTDLAAVAVSAGPGSYTGLRVGMSAAKGLCYALQIPLITINTLQQMAAAALEEEGDLLCPMIDARRMEVFTAMYDRELKEAVPYANLVLEAGTFQDILARNRVVFFGNGSEKFRPLALHPHARFVQIEATAADLAVLAQKSFNSGDFASLPYSEPFYGKDFYSTAGEKNK